MDANCALLKIDARMAIQKSVQYSILGWYGFAGKIESQEDWVEWASGRLAMEGFLPNPTPTTLSPRMLRRFNRLGHCIVAASEQCLPLIKETPAVLAVSRHGDLSLLDALIRNVRDQGDMSPTRFSISVHNRYSSAISILAGYRGVCSAYSSAHDGFPLAVCEAVSLILRDENFQVLVLGYEPEIPQAYEPVLSELWTPHAVAFVLQKPTDNAPVYSLSRRNHTEVNSVGDGSCLHQLRAILNQSEQLDGDWGYRVDRQ